MPAWNYRRTDCRSLRCTRSDTLGLAQYPECCAEFFAEDLWLFPCGEVTAFVGFVVVGEVGIGLLNPTARSLEDLVGERGEAGRERGLWRGVATCGRLRLGASELPVRPGRRGSRASTV
jgi:hypothetical protein